MWELTTTFEQVQRYPRIPFIVIVINVGGGDKLFRIFLNLNADAVDVRFIGSNNPSKRGRVRGRERERYSTSGRMAVHLFDGIIEELRSLCFAKIYRLR